jgi:uncharacterized protein DUF4145
MARESMLGENPPFNWTCPACRGHATISNSNVIEFENLIEVPNKLTDQLLVVQVIGCPNNACGELSIEAAIWRVRQSAGPGGLRWEPSTGVLERWTLRPRSEAKPMPAYIPDAIVTDYREAYMIRDLSAKASATLSRRCLQGMIRDFWGVAGKRTLKDEIEAISDKLDPDVLASINAVREVGNIGAHMEKDISIIVDVEPEEATLLLQLIEILVDEWYVRRETKKANLAAVKALAATKRAEQGK